MATYSEGAKLVGKKGSIFAGGLEVDVNVLDFKNSYGKDRWLVTPVKGNRTVWVESVTQKV